MIPSQASLSHDSPDSLERVRRMIDAAPHLPLNLAQLSQSAGYSRYHFLRLFQQRFRQTPHQYLVRRRIEKARSLLASSAADVSVTQVCFEVGFQSLGSFSALFYRHVGQSPTAYRARWLTRPPVFIPMCFCSKRGVVSTVPPAESQF